jgi:predicted ATPase
MIERVTGGKALPSEVVQQIVAKTDGVPLFVEELTKTVVESGLDVGARLRPGSSIGHVPLPLGIPATLQDALMARLDRLGPAKEIAQLGATLGREFDYALLQAVSPLNEDTLQKGLKQLVEAELVYQRGLVPQAHYLFKHALVQDTAYQSLLKSRRQQLHQQVAQVLTEQFPETVETQPELLAHHYTEAGLIEQAIPYWQKAGERAAQRSANVEAIRHFTTGLEVLKALPDTPERTQQELTLQVSLGPVLMATKGWAAPEVGKAYARALELCRQMGEPPQLFSVLRGLWEFYQMQGQYQTARELADELLTLAQSIQDPAFLLEAHSAQWQTLLPMGELVPAREHVEQGMTLYNPQQHHSHAFLYGGYDPGVVCRIFAAWGLWVLGYPDQALKRSQEALALAGGLFHPFSLAFALGSAALCHFLRREGQPAQERAEATITLSTEQGFPFWLAYGTILRGWALAEQGQGKEGLRQIRQGMAAWRATVSEAVRPYFLALLAEVCGREGQAEEGFTALSEALNAIHKTGERREEAELYRVKGTLTLQSKTSL